MPEALAWWAYSDPELTARERERIFARAWQYVGHLGELGEGAGYIAGYVGDIPVVVTRDRDGVLRAFLNVCRHRGSVLAAGAGTRETLQCPYHAWTYGLDGAHSVVQFGDTGDGSTLRMWDSLNDSRVNGRSYISASTLYYAMNDSGNGIQRYNEFVW